MAIATPALAPLRTVLPNGVTVIARQTRRTPAVTINLSLRGGAVADPPMIPGAMHLLSRVIDRGTTARSADDIADALDNRGITLTIGVTRHQLSLACTCLAGDFEAVLALLGEIVIGPTVPESELVTRKGQVITTLRQDEDNPAVRAVDTLLALLYGDQHPYGRRVKGSVESVDAITREQLLALHADRFSPSAVCAVIVGDVEPAYAEASTLSALGGWRARDPQPMTLERPERTTSRRVAVVPMMNKAQADIAYGFVALPRSDPSYYAFWLMNDALGQYALGGRLGDSIRERQGMAYYVSSRFDPALVDGPMMVRAGVSGANVDRAIASIDAEIDAMRRDGPTREELAASKQYLIGSIPRALETNAGIAQFLQTAEFFGLGLDYDQRLPGLLRAVTLDEAHAAASILDPGRATVVVAGPYERA